MAKWIQKATAKMAKKGTLGKFGKATAKKVAAGKKKGGVTEKRAVFAENMKNIAKKKKAKPTFEKVRKQYYGLNK